MQFQRYWWFMQIRQRIFNCTDMQIMHFFQDKFWNFWRITRLSVISCCKVIWSKNSPVFFWPTLYYCIHLYIIIYKCLFIFCLFDVICISCCVSVLMSELVCVCVSALVLAFKWLSHCMSFVSLAVFLCWCPSWYVSVCQHWCRRSNDWAVVCRSIFGRLGERCHISTELAIHRLRPCVGSTAGKCCPWYVCSAGSVSTSCSVSWYVGMCGKPKICSDSFFENWTIQKFNIHSHVCTTETGCYPQFKLKVVTKNNFTCIHCVDKERFETWLNQSLAYRF